MADCDWVALTVAVCVKLVDRVCDRERDCEAVDVREDDWVWVAELVGEGDDEGLTEPDLVGVREEVTSCDIVCDPLGVGIELSVCDCVRVNVTDGLDI